MPLPAVHWANTMVHVDRVNPDCGVFEHVRQDAPGAWTAGAGILGLLVGLALGRSGRAALAGAALGLALGTVTKASPSETRT